ncbi:hypothetical protein [Methanosarcina horonobensis]|uniref:hypothetical protein n=1 Tax=Methanosarcina horonobensis TaxID=418008 RepID=UPI00130140F4|nr:hypothetical protein [Methanosarcina horonobensis]
MKMVLGVGYFKGSGLHAFLLQVTRLITDPVTLISGFLYLVPDWSNTIYLF